MANEFGFGNEGADVKRVMEGPALAKLPDLHPQRPSEFRIWFYNAVDRLQTLIRPHKSSAEIFSSAAKPPKKAPYIDQSYPADTECLPLPKVK